MKCLSVGTRHSLGTTSTLSLRRSLLETSPSTPQLRHYACSPALRQRRGTHDAPSSSDEMANPPQAHPLSGYYSVVLNSRSPYRGRAPTSRPATHAPEATSTSEPQSPQEKMAIVFGTRLAGPGRSSRYNPGETPPESKWKTVNGVPIPPRPEEPDNCCMSGCVHCVWDDFRDEMEDWATRVAQAKAKGGAEKGTKDMRFGPRAEVDSVSQSMDDDGGGSEANWPAPSPDDELFANIPVGIREFMKTEKRLRAKHQQEAAV
ncbi:hypothetical protein N7474_010583 [Penicillium riverlandense]|uniref:uncharacterized protein n=1 Tax=Penicillium riverlandense TaxID=1903569 RepID=UPI002546B6A8|nr:uncharacterized protein N7474_010583 [Penicillium riverlandense]KAJ5806991.1 hypothetical protein N7474_010583 [Penicillium riverlandense]